MLLPIRTQAPIRQTPYVNMAIIAANVAVYLVLDGLGGRAASGWGASLKRPMMLWPDSLRVFQFFTYQFLHADHWHLLGNMYFLWLFGNAVNSKMGQLPYLFFYLAAGIFAGMGFAVDGSPTPCLGASGSVAGITTAYLVLFPRSSVTVVYFFYFIGMFEVSSILWIVGKMIVWDNYIAMNLPSAQFTSVAYEAHLAGYLYGFGVTSVMLWLRALPRDQYDILALWRRWYQRRTFAMALNDPNERARAQFGSVANTQYHLGGTELQRETGPIMELRAAILNDTNDDDYDSAAAKYQKLMMLDPAQVLPMRQQLEISIHLMNDKRYAQAAAGFEKYIATYTNAPDRADVRFMLGVIYARHLQRPDLAIEKFKQAYQLMTDSSLREKTRGWLAELGEPIG